MDAACGSCASPLAALNRASGCTPVPHQYAKQYSWKMVGSPGSQPRQLYTWTCRTILLGKSTFNPSANLSVSCRRLNQTLADSNSAENPCPPRRKGMFHICPGCALGKNGDDKWSVGRPIMLLPPARAQACDRLCGA